MAEVKKLRVRDAKPTDGGLFRKLWIKYLEEQHQKGNHILPNDHNMDLFEKLFNLYVSDTWDGIVLFIADKAVLMWGEVPQEFEHNLGRFANGWGTYVDEAIRERGASKLLREAAFDKLREKGFESVQGAVLTGDGVSEGSVYDHNWDKISTICVYDLRD